MVCRKIKKPETHKMNNHFCIATRGMAAGELTGVWKEGATTVGEGSGAQCGHECQITFMAYQKPKSKLNTQTLH